MPNFVFPHISLKQMDAGMLSFELLASLQEFTSEGREMVTSAAQVATFLHQGQTRRHRADMERVPYIEHPMRVALRIIRWGLDDPEVITAALFHDAVEDCVERIVREIIRTDEELTDAEALDMAFQWLSDSYSSRVAAMVKLMTVDKSKPYIEKLNGIAGSYTTDDGWGAAFLYASDLVDNAGSLPHQYGHVPDRMIDKLLGKYLPVMPSVRDMLAELPELKIGRSVGSAALAARDHLEEISTKCGALKAKRDSEASK